jgi:hypothetical protein
MTDDRSLEQKLERAARSWIEVGPTAAPPHVVDAALALIDDTPQERDWFPWRLPHMMSIARVAALVAIGAVILAGAFALGGVGGRGGPVAPTLAPSSLPAASPSTASSSGVPSFAQTFTSTVYGYAVGLPKGWAVDRAKTVWIAGAINNWGSGYNDELTQVGVRRFSAASMPLADGQTADAWLTGYAAGADRASWPTLTIGGQTGYLTADGVPAAGGTVAPGGRFFDAVVVSRGRAYNINMDGNVDRATFDAFVATIVLDPGSVGACGLLTGDEADHLDGSMNGSGATPSASGSGDETTCIFRNAGVQTVMRVDYTRTGGRTLFQAAQATSGVQSVAGLGDGAVFDPATATLTLLKGDAIVRLVTGYNGEAPQQRLALERQVAALVVQRI